MSPIVIPDELFIGLLCIGAYYVMRRKGKMMRKALVVAVTLFALGYASRVGVLPVKVGPPFFLRRW